MILTFERTGVNLQNEQLEKYKALDKEIGQLTSQYSENMNSSRDILVLDEKELSLGCQQHLKKIIK